MTKNVKVGDGHRNVKKKTIKAIIQSIGNGLIVSSLNGHCNFNHSSSSSAYWY
jgi:hypothetical protein